MVGELRIGLSSYPPGLQPWNNTGTAAQGYGMAKDVAGFKSLSGSLNFYSAYALEDTRSV